MDAARDRSIDPQPAPGSLGAVLRAAREKAGLRQFELGAVLGVSGRTVGNWERGVHDVPAGSLPALGRALGVRFTTDGAGHFGILELDSDDDDAPEPEPPSPAPQPVVVNVIVVNNAEAAARIMRGLGLPTVPDDE